MRFFLGDHKYRSAAGRNRNRMRRGFLTSRGREACLQGFQRGKVNLGNSMELGRPAQGR